MADPQKREFRKLSKQYVLEKEKIHLTKEEAEVGEIVSSVIAYSTDEVQWNNISNNLSKKQEKLLYLSPNLQGLRNVLGIEKADVEKYRKDQIPKDFEEKDINLVTLLENVKEFLKSLDDDAKKTYFKELVDLIPKADDNEGVDKDKFEDYWLYIDKKELDVINEKYPSLPINVMKNGINILEISVDNFKDLVQRVWKQNQPRRLFGSASPVQTLLKGLNQSIDPAEKDPNRFFYEWIKIDKEKLKELAKSYKGVQDILNMARKIGFVTENAPITSSETIASALIFTSGHVQASAKLLINFH